jgi:hypothetical protein
MYGFARCRKVFDAIEEKAEETIQTKYFIEGMELLRACRGARAFPGDNSTLVWTYAPPKWILPYD